MTFWTITLRHYYFNGIAKLSLFSYERIDFISAHNSSSHILMWVWRMWNENIDKRWKKKKKEEIKKKSGPWITECVFHLSSFDTRIFLSFYSFYSHHHLVSYPLTVNLFFVTSKRFQLAFIYPSPMEIRPLTTFFERTAERWHWEIVDGKIYIST